MNRNRNTHKNLIYDEIYTPYQWGQNELSYFQNHKKLLQYNYVKYEKSRSLPYTIYQNQF